MGKNTGGIDRIFRVVVAIVTLAVALKVGAGSALGIVMLAVTVIMLGTAAIGFCPLYRLFGLSTVPKDQAPR